MTGTITPAAAEFLDLMVNETQLPESWETSGLWLLQAQQLAQFMADHRGTVELSEAVMLLGLGGMLVEMAKREREASAEAGRWLRGERG